MNAGKWFVPSVRTKDCRDSSENGVLAEELKYRFREDLNGWSHLVKFRLLCLLKTYFLSSCFFSIVLLRCRTGGGSFKRYQALLAEVKDSIPKGTRAAVWCR